MTQERTDTFITHALRDDVEDYLFYTEGREEGFFFSISDYFSAYRVMLGNYCSFFQSVVRGSLDWERNPGFLSQPYWWIKVNGNGLQYEFLPDLPPQVITW